MCRGCFQVRPFRKSALAVSPHCSNPVFARRAWRRRLSGEDRTLGPGERTSHRKCQTCGRSQLLMSADVRTGCGQAWKCWTKTAMGCFGQRRMAQRVAGVSSPFAKPAEISCFSSFSFAVGSPGNPTLLRASFTVKLGVCSITAVTASEASSDLPIPA